MEENECVDRPDCTSSVTATGCEDGDCETEGKF